MPKHLASVIRGFYAVSNFIPCAAPRKHATLSAWKKWPEFFIPLPTPTARTATIIIPSRRNRGWKSFLSWWRKPIPMKLSKDLKEFIGLLNSRKIEFGRECPRLLKFNTSRSMRFVFGMAATAQFRDSLLSFPVLNSFEFGSRLYSIGFAFQVRRISEFNSATNSRKSLLSRSNMGVDIHPAQRIHRPQPFQQRT